MYNYYRLAADFVEDVFLVSIFLMQVTAISIRNRDLFCVVEEYLLDAHHEHRDCIHEDQLTLVMMRRVGLLVAAESIIASVILKRYHK